MAALADQPENLLIIAGNVRKSGITLLLFHDLKILFKICLICDFYPTNQFSLNNSISVAVTANKYIKVT